MDLESFAHEVKREDECLGRDGSQDSRDTVAGPEGQVCSGGKETVVGFVRREEQTHVRHDLRERRAQAAEIAAVAFMQPDMRDTAQETRVDSRIPLRREACP